MTFRVVYRRAARQEFEQAALWYEERRAGLGEEFIREIDDAVTRAAAAPTRYPTVFRDIRRTVARRFPYSIYFRLRGDCLVVLAVFHGRRDPQTWRGRS
jgi:plasmid stabilization system protein ParE